MQDQQSPSEKPKFDLGTSSKILIILALAIVGLLSFTFSPNASAAIPYTIGRIVGIMVIPFVLSWLAWIISRRSKTAATVVFNLFIVLAVLSQAVEINKARKKADTLNQLLSKKEDFSSTMKQSLTDENADGREALKDYSNEVISSFDELEANSSGKEKQVFAVMKAFMKEVQVYNDNFQAASGAVFDPSVLDYSLFTSPQALDQRLALVDEYQAQIDAYTNFYFNYIQSLEKKLEPIGMDSRVVKQALSGVHKVYDKQVVINRDLFQSHRDYESSIRKLLTLLKSNPDTWTVQDGYITPYSQKFLDEFNGYVEDLNDAANRVNENSRRLFETI